jgi:hypothetical protein
VVKPGQGHLRDILAEVVGVALHIRQQRIKIHQRVRLDLRQRGHVVALKGVYKQQ